ncbi:thiol-disulfide oxidoreductase DCC family protein [Candidatus Halobonum tyrrellensis]|uniref:thiol-disulfide oxidoreductase DCC family protein n=1 Tax=Candidatus Halobonum tyrrellensis TaxID=1431545 RepID=UPI001F2E2449|nr:thiol-disulfide oxidoreductase DCC family protein [Candidatus Halobonum tyrrellensis]
MSDHTDGASDPDGADDPADPLAGVDLDDHPVLLFDGVCNLCNGAVRFVVRFDDAGTFRFAPLQSDVGQALLDRYGRSLSGDALDSVVLVEDGVAYEKSDAVLRVARRLDGPWPLAYPLTLLPRRLRDAAYDVVAANRYRVFGRSDECQIPPPELRERFAERSLDGV